MKQPSSDIWYSFLIFIENLQNYTKTTENSMMQTSKQSCP